MTNIELVAMHAQIYLLIGRQALQMDVLNENIAIAI